jgi:hypothetical protein
MKKLTPLQLPLPKGATKFLIMVDNQELADKIINSPIESAKSFSIHQFIKSEAPIQKGDEYYIQEEFCLLDFSKLAKELDKPLVGYAELRKSKVYAGDGSEFLPASEMTYEQSRVKGTCIQVEIKRCQDIYQSDEWIKFGDFLDFIEEHFGDNTYDNNGYFWVVSVKGEFR